MEPKQKQKPSVPVQIAPSLAEDQRESETNNRHSLREISPVLQDASQSINQY